MEQRIAPTCDRGNDLIAFLYGEIEDREARDFERHLLSCATCEMELSSFKQVRGSIEAWRQESLGVHVQSIAESAEGALVTRESAKPSALAAIRTFLDLSPLWMKGAVAFASVLFFVVVGLAAFRLLDRTEPTITSNEKVYTEAELKQKVEEALAKQQQETPQPQTLDSELAANNQGQRRVQKPPSSSVSVGKTQRRPLTRAEREQLAADLRLTTSVNEIDLDLVDDRINK